MQLSKSLGRKNKAKKHLKTTRDGPRDPNAIFRKTRTKQQVPKKKSMHSHNDVQKPGCNLNRPLGLQAKPEENHMEATKHWKGLHASF